MLKIRCSQLGLLMTKAKSGAGLSETAKTMIKDIVREEYFGVRKTITSKAMEKGIRCEDDSIKLLNDFLFTDYVKHVGRVTNDFITGECDILSESIRDIKTSYSIATFPLFEEELHNNNYEWQMRGYMWLYDKPRAYVDYCLVDTPEDLIGWEQPEMHIVSHMSVENRVRSIFYDRDLEKEGQIASKVVEAWKYYEQLKSVL